MINARNSRVVQGIAAAALISAFIVFFPGRSYAVCGFGSDIGGGVCQGFLTTTGSNQTWTSPSDWNNSNNTIECIGGGASGAASRNVGNQTVTGGGGGAYSRIANFNVATPGTTTATYRIAQGGAAVTQTINVTSANGNAGEDTWFNNASFPGAGTTNAQCGAKGGSGGITGLFPQNGGAGGVDTSGWGETRRSGGRGGDTNAWVNMTTGGGGAAGNGSVGGAGGDGTAGPVGTNGGQANGSGAGGGAFDSGAGARTGVAGTNGTEYTTAGSGGGGGSARSSNNTATGGSGGAYGGGGGGAASAANQTVTSGAGGNGIIIITYTLNVSETPHSYIGGGVIGGGGIN